MLVSPSYSLIIFFLITALSKSLRVVVPTATILPPLSLHSFIILASSFDI